MLVFKRKVSIGFFPENDFKQVSLKRKGTPVPRNSLGAPIYLTPNEHIYAEKATKPTTSVSNEYTEEPTNPLFAPAFLQPSTLDAA